MAQMTLRDYLQETEDAISKGRIDDALSRCQCILANFPESLEAQRLLGEVYLAQGSLEEAQQTFDWVLTNDPENVIAYCDRALISERLSDYDTALDCYQQAYELSRNSQIRNEFNKLSARVGQSDFMSSRAGLARLYMRGDLLTQAIQEWEAVLSVSADRLDARTGLLETYWREGLYDRVEQLANEILREVPGCVKALLLLAFVVSAKDMRQARELLRRVEALDPDLILAQDLFADMMASQPNEPFLKLLQKPPVTIETTLLEPADAPATASNVGDPFTWSSSPQNGSSSSEALPDWAAVLDAWNGDSGISGSHDLASAPSPAASSTWSGDSFSLFESDGEREKQSSSREGQAEPDMITLLGGNTAFAETWGAPDQSVPPPQSGTSPSDSWSSYVQEPQVEPNGAAASTFSPPAGDQSLPGAQPWEESLDKFAEHVFEGFGAWNNTQDNASAASTQDENQPAPPAWLSMLTQNERKQMSGDLGQRTASGVRTPSASLPEEPSVPEPVFDLPPSWQEAAQPPAAPPVSPVVDIESDDDSPFGPEWLKSLGAATMDDDGTETPSESVAAQELPAAIHDEPQHTWAAAQESWSASPMGTLPSSQAPDATWSQPEAVSPMGALSSSPTPDIAWSQPEAEEKPAPAEKEAEFTWAEEKVAPQPAQQVRSGPITTLEELEQELRARGFVSLEPNTLAAIAQAQGLSLAGMPSAQPQEPEPAQEPTLSSALAGFGEYSEPPVIPEPPLEEAAVESPQPAQPEPLTEESQQEDPFWTAALNPVPAALQNYSIGAPLTGGAQFSSPPQPAANAQPPVEQVPETREAAPREAVPSNSAPQPKQPVTQPTPVPPTIDMLAVTVKADPFKIPAVRKDALFESGELETTMRRPAVRLQPMQQRPGAQRAKAAPLGRERLGERTGRGQQPAAHKAADGNLSNKERLVRGYQHQLVGDYDEAMQEYRIIIRNAPELLGEVVSNVRALLKLAPKYAAGYRILGDAYMRQGEYLQAMEAYNKALTMAKRARA